MKKNKLPETLTTVTWFSKLLAVILFFIFILAGVHFGMLYQKFVDANYFQSIFIQPSQNYNSIIIDSKDDHRSISAKVGDLIIFRLGNSYKWSLDFSNKSLISSGGMGIITDPNIQARFRLVKPGTLTVTGGGRVNCKPNEMCPTFVILFKVTIVVK